MKNINNNSIKFGFKILSVMAFTLLVAPISAGAYYSSGYVTPYGSYGTINYNYQPQYSYPLPVNYSNSTTAYSDNQNTSNKSNTTSTTTTSDQTQQTATTNETSTKPADSYSNLAASAIVGSNGLMPSGIIQWVLFFILVLVIVILVRKIFGAEKKYHSTPMKHA